MLLEREKYDALGGDPIQAFLSSARETVGEMQSNFKFYPIFLIQGYAAYAIVRWREFVTTGYSIQAPT